MKTEDIKKVVIVGAGTMGQQIGTQCAIHGFDVVLYDINYDILDKAFERIKKLIKSFGLFFRHSDHFHGHDIQAFFFQTLDHRPYQIS